MSSRETDRLVGAGDGSVVVRIVREVARREGRDPLDLDPPLYDVVSTDALESLHASDAGDARIEFSYLGHEIAVDADGSVTIGE